ncbi:MAG: hypothetical protein HY927_00900 [Elusimicrobia bacterium]|nr:hypothetical protein [Elusimicrobiota bacterium]
MKDISCHKCHKPLRGAKKFYRCSGCQAYFCPSCMDRFCLFCKATLKEYTVEG